MKEFIESEVCYTGRRVSGDKIVYSYLFNDEIILFKTPLVKHAGIGSIYSCLSNGEIFKGPYNYVKHIESDISGWKSLDVSAYHQITLLRQSKSDGFCRMDKELDNLILYYRGLPSNQRTAFIAYIISKFK